jgi:hypothetical protein
LFTILQLWFMHRICFKLIERKSNTTENAATDLEKHGSCTFFEAKKINKERRKIFLARWKELMIARVKLNELIEMACETFFRDYNIFWQKRKSWIASKILNEFFSEILNPHATTDLNVRCCQNERKIGKNKIIISICLYFLRQPAFSSHRVSPIKEKEKFSRGVEENFPTITNRERICGI